MKKSEPLHPILDSLLDRSLGQAIQAMDAFLSVHPHSSHGDRLHAIRTDYQMMADYWRRGFKDPQLPALYDNLLRRMYVLYANMDVDYGVGHSSFFSSFHARAHGAARDWSPTVVRESLEAFVSDVALLALEPGPQSAERRKELFAQHHQLMMGLFGHILISGIWTDGEAAAMEEMLLSPTVDTNDQQLIVSGLMLSAMDHFDIAKFRVLVHVYQQAADEPVRQRALVGWVFALDVAIGQRLYPEELELVEHLLEDERCCRELTELQKQMVYCINAEQDHATIQKEIMPDLLKNPGFRITPTGLEEQEEDPMRDILHPNEEEQRLERLESSFQKMKDMQKQGSDIYFGGFSQMKRFPFFRELTNWFVPFYADHPDLGLSSEKLSDNRFVQGMIHNGPFCDSDKYSFLLAFEQIIHQIPASMRQMMERGEASIQEISEEESRTAAYIRRTYLQNLYRFFRLYSRREEFTDIFGADDRLYLFFASPIFSGTRLEPHFHEVAAFLIKKKRLDDARMMLDNYGTSHKDFQYYMMAGHLIQNGFRVADGDSGDRLSPIGCYAEALRLNPGHERAVMGYARALFDERRFQESLAAYDQLLAAQPERRDCLLNKAVCLTKLARYGEALQLLFRLSYEAPDDLRVSRVLAWALTCDGRYDQAEKLYGQLLSVENPSSDDLLNLGYCLWFRGSVDEAADCFHRYLKESGQRAEDILDTEAELISQKGITEAERQLMLSIL